MARFVITEDVKDALWAILARTYSVKAPWTPIDPAVTVARQCSIRKFSPDGERCTNRGAYVRGGKQCCTRCHDGTDDMPGKRQDYQDALDAATAHGVRALAMVTDAASLERAKDFCKRPLDSRSDVRTPRPF